MTQSTVILHYVWNISYKECNMSIMDELSYFMPYTFVLLDTPPTILHHSPKFRLIEFYFSVKHCNKVLYKELPYLLFWRCFQTQIRLFAHHSSIIYKSFNIDTNIPLIDGFRLLLNLTSSSVHY